MLTMHFVLIIISFFVNILFYLYLSKDYKIKNHIYYLFLLLIIIIINPIFYHKGSTILFFIRNNAFTLESLLYGVNQGLMVISIIYLFKSFSIIFTVDKIIYVLSFFSMKISLILCITLRYISLFKIEYKKIELAGKGLGLYSDYSMIDKIKAKTQILSVLVTWALENGIKTSDSMAARGYGATKRTSFSIYRFTMEDKIYIFINTFFLLLLLFYYINNHLYINFYPTIQINTSNYTFIIYFIFLLINISPFFINYLYNTIWKIRIKNYDYIKNTNELKINN